MILPPFFAIHPSVLDTARVLRVANLLTSALCQEYHWNDRARSRDAHHTIGIASSEKEDALIVAANRARTVFYAICLRNSDFWAGVSPRNTAASSVTSSSLKPGADASRPSLMMEIRAKLLGFLP